MGNTLFTAGELAKMACVSNRTIRFYDSKGLLKPVKYGENGYRFYDRNSFLALQRIQILKYVGFSLQEIEALLADQLNIDEHINEQYKLLLDRKSQIEQMLAAIEIAKMSSGEEKWNSLLHLSDVMSMQQKVDEQYRSSDNLERRINIHSFSTSEENWFDWLYDRIDFKENQKILELGCGTGLLWEHNIKKLPDNLEIILSDNSQGMIDQTKTTLEKYADYLHEKNIKISYLVADASTLELNKDSFDIIIANHMLYHVANLANCLSNVSMALKPSGKFYCSTVGDNHMKELHDLVADFRCGIKIEVPFDNITAGFRIENGMEKLKAYFESVECEIQDNALIVDDEDVIFNYVYSYPGNAPFILDKYGEDFRKLIRNAMEKEGAMYIQKVAGIFTCINY